MDLVTDIKRDVENSTKKTINTLKTVYSNIEEKNKKFYKDINIYYMIMSIWVNKLSYKYGNEENKNLLYNILVNYCSIINCVTLGDIKLINFLYRNTIEGVIRFISGETKSKDIEKIFRCISKNMSYSEDEIIILQSYASQLKSIYTDSCLYIHTDVSKIDKDIANMIKYRFNMENVDLEDTRRDFVKMNNSIINIFKIIYYDVYMEMKDNSKALHDEILPLKENMKVEPIVLKKYKLK